MSAASGLGLAPSGLGLAAVGLGLGLVAGASRGTLPRVKVRVRVQGSGLPLWPSSQ